MIIRSTMISLAERTAIYWDALWVLRNNQGDVERRRRALQVLQILARRDASDHLRRVSQNAVMNLRLDADALLLPECGLQGKDPTGSDPTGSAA